MAPRETENNAYAKFWGDKQRALWSVMVFSGAVSRGKEEPDFQTKLFYMYIHHFGPAVIGANCFGVPARTPVNICTLFCSVTLIVWQS